MGVFSRRLAVVSMGVVLLTIATGCATSSRGAPPPTPLTVPTPPTIVVGTGTVIQSTGAARLCFIVLESYPPQCGEGVELGGWTWDGVDGSETVSGVTWGAYAVQGNLDAEVLRLTEPPVLLALFDPAPYAPSDDTVQKDLDERFGEGSFRIVDPPRTD